MGRHAQTKPPNQAATWFRIIFISISSLDLRRRAILELRRLVGR